MRDSFLARSGTRKSHHPQADAAAQTELRGTAARTGLAHYALGVGTGAARISAGAVELQLPRRKATERGRHYALGLCLGNTTNKRCTGALAGGGDWADKQLKELEPDFAAGALSLQKAAARRKRRAIGSADCRITSEILPKPNNLRRQRCRRRRGCTKDSSCKAICSFNGRSKRATAAKTKRPKKKAFSAAVRHCDAAQIGQSDAEVYEGLAGRGFARSKWPPPRSADEVAYAAAIENSDKITTAEPHSTAGPQKAYAALLTMAGTGSAERVQRCLAEAQAVLVKEPGNPYASDVAAGCNAFVADVAQSRGDDPEPLYAVARAA